MARPLRIDLEGGWYHVTARGMERRRIFVDPRDHAHFWELLEETVARFRVRMHAHVEVANHYHLIMETPDANLSRAVQWLNVSYAAWFNRRHERVGPLFQGRFKSIPVQDSAWAYELSLYVHLNPVMSRAHGLDKTHKRIEAQGLDVPDPATVTRRLAALRQYAWSSYGAYAGYAKAPVWLRTEDILARADRRAAQQSASYREDVRQRLTKGVAPELRERLADGFALGAEEFRERMRKCARRGREIAAPRGLRQSLTLEQLAGHVAALRGEPAAAFLARRGDWARPLLLWAAQRYAGMTLKEIGAAAGGMDYTAVAMAIRRFEQRSEHDRALRAKMRDLVGRLKV